MRKVEKARPSGRICILSGTSDENEFEKAPDIGFDCTMFSVSIVCLCTYK